MLITKIAFFINKIPPTHACIIILFKQVYISLAESLAIHTGNFIMDV